MKNKDGSTKCCHELIVVLMITATSFLAILPVFLNLQRLHYASVGVGADTFVDNIDTHNDPASQDFSQIKNADETGGFIGTNIHGSRGDTAQHNEKTKNNATTSPNSSYNTLDEMLVVHTKLGPIKAAKREGVRVFHGVPFAQPPIGDLRWRPPRPMLPWLPEVYDATWVRPGCPQKCSSLQCPANGTSEDCLFLEIFVPSVEKTNSNHTEERLPVLVYIHGGSFKDMSATTPVFDGALLAQKANMIVVLPEYRLGSLGFLVTGTGPTQAEGNYGIMDQTLAIKWVSENIEEFGGDPKKVTLAGHSAGAISILVHLENPETASRFRYVILSSAPYAFPFRTIPHAATKGQGLATKLGCLKKSAPEPDMICMRNKSVQELMAAEASEENQFSLLSGLLNKIMPFGPVVDGTYVKMSPIKAILQSNKSIPLFGMKPMIVGTVTDEAYLFKKQFSQLGFMKSFFMFTLSLLTGASLSDLHKYYPEGKLAGTVEAVISATNDIVFECPLRAALHRVTSYSPGFNASSTVTSYSTMFNASTIPASSSDNALSARVWSYIWKKPMDENHLPKDLAMCKGHACHGVELPFLFQTFKTLGLHPKPSDIQLSNTFIKYLRNFVHNGDPNIYFNNDIPTNSINKDAERDRVKRRTTHFVQVNNKTEFGSHKQSRNIQIVHSGKQLSIDQIHKVDRHQRRRRKRTNNLLRWPSVADTVKNDREFPQLNVLPDDDIVINKFPKSKCEKCDFWDKTGYLYPTLFG